jgi:charged multivesicular body protein 3
LIELQAGIIEEMMDDAMESVTDEEGIEEEADSEVEKVLWELTEGKLGEAPRAIADSLPSSSMGTRVPAGAKATRTAALVDPDMEGDEDMETMRKRLEHLKS